MNVISESGKSLAVFACVVLTLAVGLGAAEPCAAQSQKTSSGKSSGKSSKAKKTAIDEGRALSIIRARPEVKSWLDAIAKSKLKGSSAHVELDRKEGNEFVVHVFEFVVDDEKSGEGHTATFNWYYVDARSGKVRKEFP